MNKEKSKIDAGLDKKLDELLKEEGGKIASEEQLRKSIWALEVLKRENKVNSDTKLEELILTVTEKIIELKQTLVYSKEIIDSRAGDEIDAELHKVAKKEFETAERLLGYMQAALFSLQPMAVDTYSSHMTFKDIENIWKKSQAAKEFLVDQDEKMRRREKK